MMSNDYPRASHVDKERFSAALLAIAESIDEGETVVQAADVDTGFAVEDFTATTVIIEFIPSREDGTDAAVSELQAAIFGVAGGDAGDE